MSMKFLSGLQDLLGLYDSAGGSSPSQQSPSSPIPPQNGLFPVPSGKPVRKSPHELNQQAEDESPVQRCSHDRNVRFDDSVVTGYCAAPTSPFCAASSAETVESDEVPVPDPAEILASYRRVCARSKVQPSSAVERQIGYLHRSTCVRQEALSLKGERVSHGQMEALEELFRRVQFDSLDFEYTFLDDDCLVSLSEMLEFYDSANKLNLSFNRQVGVRGWTALLRAVRNCPSLQVLNLRYTSIERAFPALCRCLRVQPASSLTCLHLENVALAGKNLLLLACALKTNVTLKELYLGENQLQPTDGAHLHQLITTNTTLQMLDLRNNELADAGLRHLCDALRNPDTCARSALSALVLWNNRITWNSMDSLARALQENQHVETLNIGNNPLCLEGLQQLQSALASSTSLHRLGLQNTRINCQAAIILAESLADNTAMVRVDLRDNPNIGSAGLLALHSAMKMNTSITLMNLDHTCAIPSSEKEDFQRYFDEIRQFCERNKQAALRRLSVQTTAEQEVTEGDMVIVTAEQVDEKQPNAVVESTTATVPCTSTSTISTSLPKIGRSSSDTTSTNNTKRITRSSSLTCAETVADINERLREMTGSTHSLEEASNVESTRTVKKFSVTKASDNQLRNYWGSLPAIPAAVPPSTAAAPVVRKMRRFSVSPSSSIGDVTTSPAPTTVSSRPQSDRPTSLCIGIPARSEGLQPSGPLSAPVCSSLPESLNLWSPANIEAGGCSPVAEHPCLSGSTVICPETSGLDAEREAEELRLKEKQLRKDVKQVVSDLVNYVVYETESVTERKASILLGSRAPDFGSAHKFPSCSADNSSLNTPTTPSRMADLVEGIAQEDQRDDVIVSSVVRQLVRDVLQVEKDQLRLALERHRRKMGASSAPGTPI